MDFNLENPLFLIASVLLFVSEGLAVTNKTQHNGILQFCLHLIAQQLIKEAEQNGQIITVSPELPQRDLQRARRGQDGTLAKTQSRTS